VAPGTVNNYIPTKTSQISNVDAVNPAIFDLNQNTFSAASYDSTFDDSLLSSYGETGTVNFGSAGSAFDLQNNAENEHEKRKSPDDEEEDDDDDEAHKRQEGDDKVAKKPGRKLIVAEPTTVSPPHCLMLIRRALNLHRNEKLKTALLSEHSEIERKST